MTNSEIIYDIPPVVPGTPTLLTWLSATVRLLLALFGVRITGAATLHFTRHALLVFALAFAPCWSHAAVIEHDWKTPGDGLLTYDTLNQREWLNLTETQLFNFPGDTPLQQFAAVVEQTSPAGAFEGFQVATSADVYALAISAGIDTSTYSLSVNRIPSELFIELVGETRDFGSASLNRSSAGILAEPSNVAEVVYAPQGLGSRPGPPGAGLVTNGYVETRVGVWLYRPVPEPSSGMLVGLTSFIFVAIRVYFGGLVTRH